MAKRRKKYRGHYCKVCGNILPNEKFSGKGHAKHICKKCSSIPKTEQDGQIVLNKIYNLLRFPNLSKQNRIHLEHYAQNKSLKIKEAAEEILKHFTNNYSKNCETFVNQIDDGIDLLENLQSQPN